MLHMGIFRGALWKANVLLVVVVLATVLPLTMSVEGHLDPPSSPSLTVDVYLKNIRLLEDQDDGIDGNAELIIGWLVSHEAHGSRAGVVTIDDFNWDYEQSRDLNLHLYSHVECSPLNRIILDVQVKEDDSDAITTIIAGVGAAVGGVVAGVLTTGTAVVVGIAGGASGLVSLFASLNAVDDLGRALLTVTGPGTYKLRGQGFEATFEVTVSSRPNPACSPPQPAPAASLPEGVDRSLEERVEQGRSSFDTLRDAVRRASTVGAEAGNPADLSNEEVEEMRSVLPRTILLDVVDPWITLVAKMAADTSGGSPASSEALGRLYEARSLASRGEFDLAIDSYEAAWMVSVKEIFGDCRYGGTVTGAMISVVDENRRPVKNVVVELYRGSDPVLSVEPEDGVVRNFALEPGAYQVRVKTKFLGMGVDVASATLNLEESTNLTVVVYSMLVPIEWIPALGNLVVALLLGAVSSQIAGRALSSRDERTRRIISIAAGLGVIIVSFTLLQGLL